MTFVVTYAGTSPVQPAAPGLVVWSYRIEPIAGDVLSPGAFVALALPAEVEAQGPENWPELPELAGMFIQHEALALQQYVGRAVTAAGTQTLSFVGPAASTPCDIQLVTAQSGGAWTVNTFALAPNGPANPVQTVPGPAPTSVAPVSSPASSAPVSGGAVYGSAAVPSSSIPSPSVPSSSLPETSVAGPSLVLDPSIPPTSAMPIPATPDSSTPAASTSATSTPASSTPASTAAGSASVDPAAPSSGADAGTKTGSGSGSAKPPPRSGRPVSDFAGTLPYASEMFGVYQPLAGWLGGQNARRAGAGTQEPPPEIVKLAAFRGDDARNLKLHDDLLQNPSISQYISKAAGGTSALDGPAVQGVLSPVGLVNLFRQYFFEFDTFLGTPAGHIWISPGGVVEVIEISTRRTTIEKTTEQSETTSRKTEEDLTTQDDIADAVKEDNANDTKLGISASGGASGKLGIATYHAEASASFSTDSSVKSSSEDTHKHSRTQSSKVSSEITRNYKTTFKTVTDNTDTSSRRYVVQNTTDKLVNYELRRKVRKVGVQLQHIGSRLSWQIFVDNPGRDLGMGDLVVPVPAPDLSALRKPDQPPPLAPRDTQYTAAFPVRKVPGTENDIPPNEDFGLHDKGSNDIRSYANNDHAVASAEFSASPPAAGYFLAGVHLNGASSGGGPTKFIAQEPSQILDPATGHFVIMADFFNSGNANVIELDLTLTWNPPTTDPAQVVYQQQLHDYEIAVAQAQQAAYAEAVRTRLNLVSNLGPRPAEDLRSEERHLVYGQLLNLLELPGDAHMDSEFIRQIFDVDDMLYFAAPDYWRPGTTFTAPNGGSVGRYPVPQAPDFTVAPDATHPLASSTVVSWYSQTDRNNALDPAHNASDEYRVNYLITEDTQPAPMGSSLGWLIQIDGDERRNEFLNAAWVKVVLPIRPGHELDGLAWLAQTAEGEAGLGMPYPMQPGDPADYEEKTVGEVLQILATQLQASNTDLSNMLATEVVFENGFDPLEGGFRPADPYQVFDQWIEVLPTDQIAAVEVVYDPKTGQQI